MRNILCLKAEISNLLTIIIWKKINQIMAQVREICQRMKSVIPKARKDQRTMGMIIVEMTKIKALQDVIIGKVEVLT